MPLQIPVLDDRRFADLVDEARSLIPTYAPAWTNHNPSDPGITLVELFAHLAEMLIYRLDRVTTANVVAFLNLLDGETRHAEDFDGKSDVLAAEIRATILTLRQLDRAVSLADFEQLALAADPQGRIERARAVSRRNLLIDLARDKPGHVSVIILPVAGAEPQLNALRAAVDAYLEPRLLLTTRADVVGPFFVDVSITVTVVPLPDQFEADVAQAVAGAVVDFLDPHHGGVEGTGWPFGRDLFASELYAVIDRLPQVDYVSTLKLAPVPASRLMVRTNGKLIGVSLRSHELVRGHISVGDVTVATV
jgi:baseplate J-like protein